MADFEPNTTIYFARTGVTDTDKILCVDSDSNGPHTQDKLVQLFTATDSTQAKREHYSFQRADGFFTIRVDTGGNVNLLNYYNLCKCDSLLYLNEEYNTSAFWVFGNILSVEWKNPDCSFVHFKIDYFMTFQHLISWNKTYAFIERTHVKEDWSSGWNPLFSNIGPAEDFSVNPDTPLYFWNKHWEPTEVLIQSPYDKNGDVVFDGKVTSNLYSSLQLMAMSADEANEYFKTIAEKEEDSINNIVGVYGIPPIIGQSVADGQYFSDGFEDIPAINHMDTSDYPVEYNNAKCWSSPFFVVRLMSSDGDIKDFTPQWFGNDVSDYRFIWRYGCAGGQFTGFEGSFLNKNGTFKEWIGWKDYTVSISQLPACPWTGDGFTDWGNRNLNAIQAKALSIGLHQMSSTISSTSRAVQSFSSGNVLGGITGASDAIANIAGVAATGLGYQAKVNNQKATGTTVNGGGSFNALMDIAAEQWGFSIIVYGTQMYTMLSVDAYFDRFGYRINRIEKLGLKNRKHWTYIKTVDCHVQSKAIPFQAMRAINAMFDAGVTMWSFEAAQDTNIGIGGYTFSARQENRGHPSLVP